MSLEKIYAAELDRLQNLGREFARENPSMAPFLAGAGGDADVERLLQGFAFLSAMVRQKMDDQIPEFIGDVADLVGPELVKPMPAITVLRLSVSGNHPEGYVVNQGTVFASKPIEGTSCQFTTSWPLTIQPLVVRSAIIRALSATQSRLTLGFGFEDAITTQWAGKDLALYFGGAFREASIWLSSLRKRLIKVSVRSAELELPSMPLQVEFTGLNIKSSLFNSSQSVASHLRLLREFQAFPEKALFVRLTGFENWQRALTALPTIDFDFDIELSKLPKPSPENFVLNATPAANIFETYANPIEVTHLRESYPLVPGGADSRNAQLFEVLNVTGRLQGNSLDRHYVPTTSLLVEDTSLKYQVIASEGTQISSQEYKLRLPFTDSLDLVNRETLSIQILCTNGNLIDRIRIGDICLRTALSPEKVKVTNITFPVRASRPTLGNDSMWRIISHARLNLKVLADADTLKEILQMYLPEGGDPARLAAARRRVQGIEDVRITEETRLIKGSLIRGQNIHIRLGQEYFSSDGDLVLFGELLAQFLAGTIALNSYVTVSVTNTTGGNLYVWPNLIAPSLTF
ncbi:MAG: type VI secretion system baseplate subunit TssF [Candidatus Methylopumilus sp.]|nr:type VI secretion system baseplate subunit TssF [Candidatus Methylopumilus sp.]